MMCYRDRTFCIFYENCISGATCSKALTEQVKINAVKWWGDIDPPIAIYTGEPSCFEDKKLEAL
ncbi:MAG: hypothetical protein PF569_09255 [Candidatus Woesearchaeota archaeon]|jgi:hypothetical protein|nr:hypothetical protein [Candidatus Woesearchaeota archaeon]